MTLRRSGKVCVTDASSLFCEAQHRAWQRTGAMALGGRTDLRLAESVQAAAGSIRKAGGHSRGILVLGVRSDMLALPASRLGGGLKLSFARNTLTCPRVAPTIARLHDRPDHLALPHRGEARRRRHGGGL